MILAVYTQDKKKKLNRMNLRTEQTIGKRELKRR